MRTSLFSAVAALAALQFCAAQTFTSCDPTKKSCPPDPALGRTVTIDFTKGPTDEFNLLAGTTLSYQPDGAHFTISKSGEAPTIVSKWYMFFGRVDVVMKSAPGVGIVSSFVMESDDLDEIDFEWLGGSNFEVESNYFGKGDTSTYDRAIYHNIAPPEDAFHTYSVDWNAQRIQWLFDGAVLRTLTFAQAPVNRYPQTPMQVRIGNWAGGDPSNPVGTRQWAGGDTDYTKGPFTMVVKSITAQDATTGGSEYVYGDMSGSYQSIKVIGAPGGSNSGSSSSSSSSSSSGSSSVASSSSSAIRPSTSATPSSTVSPPSSSTSVSSATHSTTSSPIQSSSASTFANNSTLTTSTVGTSSLLPSVPSITRFNPVSTTSAAPTSTFTGSAARSLNVNGLAVALLVAGLGYILV